MNSVEIIQREIDWLERIVKVRIEFPKVDIFDQSAIEEVINKSSTLLMRKAEYDLSLPELNNYSSFYTETALTLDRKERLMLAMALSVHIEPGLIDRIIAKNQYAEVIEKNPGFLLSAGIVSKGNYGYLPTGRLWLYLISGSNTIKKVELMKVLANGLGLVNSGLVEISHIEDYEPFGGGLIVLSHANLIRLLS